MSAVELLTLQFALACGGCLAAGLLVWLTTSLNRTLLGTHRAVWLLGQLTIAAAFLIIMVPHSERLRMVPAIDLDNVVNAGVSRPLKSAAAPAQAAAPSAPAPGQRAQRPLVHAAQAWLILYLLGLGHAVLQLIAARRALQGLAAAGSPIGHQGSAHTLSIVEVDAPISPMLFGLFHPRLLLPRHLRQFEPIAQQLIVEHELTHLRRHDLLWMSAAITLQTVFWFNPFMRLLGKQLLWAQELGCDRAVLEGRPDEERRAYAAALVAQLKHQRRDTQAALAFGGVNTHTVAARITHIRTPPDGAAGRRVRLMAFCGLVLIIAASLVFQPALAWRQGPAATDCTIMADAATGEVLFEEGHCNERATPASTFNIVVSLMGYDSGILHDEHAPVLPFKAGYADYIASWRAATDPSSWIQNSVLWYAQQVTTRLGPQQFQRYMTQFDYGNGDIAGDPGKANGLTTAWLGSSLQVSPIEQLAFLRKVVRRELALSDKAYEMTSRIMVADMAPGGWEIRGKTGTANPILGNGAQDKARQYGWYVGWARQGTRTVVFARLRLDQRIPDSAGGMRAKRDFLHQFSTRMAAR